jgi:hypothetical protein
MGPPDVYSAYDPPEQPCAAPVAPAAELALLRRWERLRVLYNLILIAEVLLLSAFAPGHALGDRAFWRLLVFGALVANLCYCVGPIANAYAHWLGLRHPAVTIVLFVAGTALAALLALVSIIGFGLAAMD